MQIVALNEHASAVALQLRTAIELGQETGIAQGMRELAMSLGGYLDLARMTPEGRLLYLLSLLLTQPQRNE